MGTCRHGITRVLTNCGNEVSEHRRADQAIIAPTRAGWDQHRNDIVHANVGSGGALITDFRYLIRSCMVSVVGMVGGRIVP